MTKKQRAAKVRVQVLTRPYDGKIITDKSIADATPPLRFLDADPKKLAQLLGLSRDLLRRYIKQGVLHEARPGELVTDTGLLSEELTAIQVMGHLHEKREMPAKQMQMLFVEATGLLFTNTAPWVISMTIIDGRKGGRLACDYERPRLPDWWAEQSAKTTCFNLTEQQVAMERALMSEPIRLPRLLDCVCTPFYQTPDGDEVSAGGIVKSASMLSVPRSFTAPTIGGFR